MKTSRRSFHRLFHIPQDRQTTTRLAIKWLVDLCREAGQNLETYFPGLAQPGDGISDQAFGAFLGSMFFQFQIGTTEFGHRKDEPCSMRHFATQAEYSLRHFFRVQHATIEYGIIFSDHDAQGLPAKRGLAPKLLACLKPLLEKYFKHVPKDIKDYETIVRWIANFIQKGRDYLASQASVKALADKKPTADPAVRAGEMRRMRDILGGKGGGSPAPAV